VDLRSRCSYRAAFGDLFGLRFGSAEAFALESRPIKTANASLPGGEHLACIVNSTRASLWLFGGSDPVDPISSREGRDVRPCGPRLWGGGKSLPQIGRHPRLRFLFLCSRRDLQRYDVARVCIGSFAHLSVHFEPVASLAVRFKRGSKGDAIDGAFDCRQTPRRQFRPCTRWQDKKGPRAGLPGRYGSPQFGAKMDHEFFVERCHSFSPL
jgi:hypothetical protein